MGSMAQQLPLAQQFSQLGTWLRRRWPVRHPRLFINSRGVTQEVVPGSNQRRYVRFPVHLAVSYGAVEYEAAGCGAVGDEDEGSRIYNSFVLNASRGGLFIISERPFPRGSILHIHFFIPPEEKLLGAFEGEVVGVNEQSSRYPQGMHVRLLRYADDMKRFIDYTEERSALLDQMAQDVKKSRELTDAC